MALFLLVRAYELRTNRVFFAPSRDRADMFVLRAFVYMRRGVVREVKQKSKNVFVNALHRLTLFALSLTRSVEEKLVSFIAYMRDRTARGKGKKKPAEPSAFLKTVVEERREERGNARER
jgi:hypothetical protein